MKRTLIATTAALLCFGLANSVLAQTATQPQPRQDRRAERIQQVCENIDSRLDGRLASLQTRLKITDQQKPAWNNYATAMRSSLDPLRQDCAAGRLAQRPTTVPQRLDAMQRVADARETELRTLKPAAEQLYAALSPDQKKTADRILLQPRFRG